jgi:subtilase family serine protease
LNRFALAPKATPALALSVVLLAALSACGGGTAPEQTAQAAEAADTPSSAAQDTSDSASAATPPSTDAAALDSTVAAALASTEVLPSYNMAPTLLDEPDQADVGGTNNSAHQNPKTFRVDADAAGIDTVRLTRATLAERVSEHSRTRAAAASGDTTTPLSTAIIGAVHTPAQIRAAYGLPALPAVGASISAAMAASLGAGQTIYLVDAYHDATALSDLNAFSARFGLPSCARVGIATNAALPLAKPPSSCTFAQVSTTTTGTMTSTVPPYNATWAPESKLDVQWAHAIAPLARIVLLEMPSSMSNAILGANTLAARMGPGAVSMSFGSSEAGWVASVDSYFKGNGMTYVAAAGDSGAQVLWPAVSPNVVAVGGTSLNWSGSGTRYEAVWQHSGGGMSAYEALPSWQSGVRPAGGSTLVRRAVPDVAFNANPMTGEYVALTLPGASTVWNAYGGTSIAAPQWAGIIAVANAMRASGGKAPLGDIHTLLYKSIAAVPGTYAAALGDVIDGTNGTCATCRAGSGFDQSTGWGTPNSAHLLQTLTGGTTTVTAPATTNHAPTLAAVTLSAKAGVTFAARVTGSDADGNALTYSASGVPSGATLMSSGILTGKVATKGTYRLTVTVRDTHGATGTGVVTLVVS